MRNGYASKRIIKIKKKIFTCVSQTRFGVTYLVNYYTFYYILLLYFDIMNCYNKVEQLKEWRNKTVERNEQLILIK